MDVVQERDVNNVVQASVTRDGNIGGILARSTPGLDTVQPIDQTGSMMAQVPVRAKARLRQVNWGGSNGARMAAAPMAAGNQSSMATAQATTGTDTAMATRGGTTTYFGYDPQGNVTTLTDSAGAVVGSYNYDAWGNLLASSGPRAGENPYRFATKESLGGLSFFGYRFYNAGTGRWINRDPLREDGGANLYMGMGNNPVNGGDEYGLIQTVKVSGNNIKIYLPMQYVGPGATPSVRKLFNSSIVAAWSGHFGKYNVRTFVVPPKEGQPFNQIWVEKGIHTSSSIKGGYFPGLYSGRWYTGSPYAGEIAAHEAGHLMGLTDKYYESFLSELGLVKRATPPIKGWENNIMANYLRPVDSRNIKGIIEDDFSRKHVINEPFPPGAP